MRQIGTLADSTDATRFAAYLVSQGIVAQAEGEGAAWSIWVRDEDQLILARAAFSDFQTDPSHAKFQDAERIAEQVRRDEAEKREAARRNVVQMGNRWGSARQASLRRRPLTLGVILLCGIIGFATNMGLDWKNPTLGKLLFRSPSAAHDSETMTASEKLVDIRRGEYWRILTPAVVHFGAMHLAFNAVMFYQLGVQIEHFRGRARFAALILVIAVVSNLAQALAPARLGGAVYFAGLSGVVFGLFGYVWMKSRFEPALGLYVRPNMVMFSLVFLVLGFAGAFNTDHSSIANLAHGFGFVTGLLIGIAPFALRQVSRG